MNFKKISFYLSLFCFPVSLLSFVNILYASYFDYFLSIETSFIILVVSLLVGLGFFYYGKKSPKNNKDPARSPLEFFIILFITKN